MRAQFIHSLFAQRIPLVFADLDPPTLSQEGLSSVITLPLQSVNLEVEVFDEPFRPVHRGHQSTPLAPPPVEAVDLGASPPILGFDLFTEAALARFIFGNVDESHPACFARPILVIASVCEASPAPVSTGEPLLVVKAHCCRRCVSPTRS